MPRSPVAVLALVALIGLGCATSNGPDPEAPLGTRTNPLRAPTFMGFLEYLGRLRCPGGTQPHARGLRTHPAETDGALLEQFALRCIYMNRESVALFDLRPGGYVEREPLPGYTMLGEPDRARLFWLP